MTGSRIIDLPSTVTDVWPSVDRWTHYHPRLPRKPPPCEEQRAAVMPRSRAFGASGTVQALASRANLEAFLAKRNRFTVHGLDSIPRME